MTRRCIAIVAASPAIVGGHSVQASELQRRLSDEGIGVCWIPIDARLPSWLAPIRGYRGLRTIANELLYLWSLRRCFGADVVHAFSASYWSFLLAPVPAMIAGRLAGARVVLHYHSGAAADHLDRWGLLVHPWLALAHDIVVCSRFQQAAFARHGHRAHVISNVVDLDAFVFRERAPLKPRFICTRNFEAGYGVETVIDAFVRIRTAYPDATLLLAGAGTLEPALKERAGRVGTRGITFLGSVPPADMPRLLDSADIYLNASTIDNQPVSLIEAASSGLPVISTPTGGIPEMLGDGNAGVLVTAPGAEAVAVDAIALLEDPERGRRLARQARIEAERFTWPSVRRVWAGLYGFRFHDGTAGESTLATLRDAGGRA